MFSRTDLTSMVGSGAAVCKGGNVHKLGIAVCGLGWKGIEGGVQVWSQGENDPRQGEMSMTGLKGSGKDGEDCRSLAECV